MKQIKNPMIALLLSLCCMGASAQVNDNHTGLIGFANYRDLGINGTTGGATGQVVRVSTRDQLEQYAKGNTPYIIIIENDITGKGNIGEGAAGIQDYISIGSNKTIIGSGSGITLNKVGFDVKNQQNIIIRNLKITNCNPDALAFRDTHHVWVDHCDLSSSADGLLDFTLGSSYLSVSWTKFSNHDKTSICNSGTNHFEDHGKERATYHHCWFDNTTQRNPRFGYGLGHVFNNYYTNNSSYCVGYHTRAKVVVENSYFKNTHSPLNQMYSSEPDNANYADALSRGNKYENVSGNTKDTGIGFDISRYYDYASSMQSAENIKDTYGNIGLATDIEHDLIPFPGEGAIDVLKDYKLQCGKIDGATSYTYMLAKEGESLYSQYEEGKTELQPSTNYTWYAEATTSEKTYKSSTFHFSTASEKASKPTPIDGDEHANLREALKDNTPCTPTLLRWREAFDAKSYRVYLSEGNKVNDNDFIGEVTIPAIAPGSLKYGEQYTWRVDVITGEDNVITGDTWTFTSDKKEAKFGRTEMEDATRNGIAYIEEESTYRTYSNGKAVVGEAGPGCMSAVWSEADANCDITTTFFDWQKKNGTYALYINEELCDTWIATVNGKDMFTHTSKNIALKQGDEIRINFCTDGNQRIRTDCIDIAKSTATGITEINTNENTKELRIYTIDGHYVGNHIEGLAKGVYIVNGKKVLL